MAISTNAANLLKVIRKDIANNPWGDKHADVCFVSINSFRAGVDYEAGMAELLASGLVKADDDDHIYVV